MMLAPLTTARTCYILLVLFSFFIPFAVQIILVRFLGLYREKALRQKGPVAATMAGLLPVGVLFLAWLLVFSVRPFSAIFWSGFYLFSVYLLAAYVYFHIFNMSETARRIRILAQGHRAGAVVKDEMSQNYSPEQMIDLRVERLLALNEIALRGERYFPARGRLVKAAELVFFLRRIIFPPAG
ncbi:MAG: hypothetical protein V1789_11055 [PVC group bacterium]